MEEATATAVEMATDLQLVESVIALLPELLEPAASCRDVDAH